MCESKQSRPPSRRISRRPEKIRLSRRKKAASRQQDRKKMPQNVRLTVALPRDVYKKLAITVQSSYDHAVKLQCCIKIGNTSRHTFKSFECSFITLQLASDTLTVFNIYRPPTSSNYSQKPSVFLDEFASLLSLAATTPNEF